MKTIARMGARGTTFRGCCVPPGRSAAGTPGRSRAVPEQPDLRPLRIALVLAGSVGGIGRHVASVAPRLVARGHTVTVYAPEVTAAAQGFVALGLDVAPLSALPRLRADVVHAHGYKAAVVNYNFIANAVLTTDDAVKAMR